MKKILILSALLIGSVLQTNAQNSSQCTMTQLIAGGGRNFKIIGSESNSFADSLFSHFPDTKRKGYVWKFKKVHIPGIEEPLTLQVHQGLSGSSGKASCDNSVCRGGSYFNTFTSERYKQKRLNQNISSEQPAIIIYIKRGRNYGVSTKEEAELVRNYLLSVYQS